MLFMCLENRSGSVQPVLFQLGTNAGTGRDPERMDRLLHELVEKRVLSRVLDLDSFYANLPRVSDRHIDQAFSVLAEGRVIGYEFVPLTMGWR